MSMNAVTLSIVQLLSKAQLDLQVAGVAIVIAAIMNTISKGAIVYFTGSQALRRTVISSFALIFIVGLLSSILMLWFI